MTDSVLQDFLDNRFIKTAEDSDLDKLKKVSSDIQKQLRKNKTKVISYALVALDPMISDDDPVVCEVELILIKHWKSFKNSVANTQDKPISYIQAVILDALESLSKDIKFAAIIWYSSCHIIHHYKLAGQGKVLNNFLMLIGQRFEDYAHNSWCVIESFDIEAIGSMSLSLPKYNQIFIEEGKLVEQLKSASVHKPWAAQAGGGDNPSHENAGNYHWSKYFSEKAGEGLSQEINRVFEGQNSSIEKLQKNIGSALNSAVGELQPYLESISSSILQSTQSQNKRSNLMWWKQALYSNTLGKGYRQVSGYVASIAMAVDLNNSVDDIYPKSVDYFLEETLRDVLNEQVNSPVEIKKILKNFTELDFTGESPLQCMIVESDGRKTLVACLAEVIKGTMTADEFFQCTGMRENEKITLAELTVWILHDLKASSIANSK